MKIPFLEKPQLYAIADEVRDSFADYAKVPVDIERILELGFGFQFELIDGLQSTADVDALLLTGPKLRMAIDADQYLNERFWTRLRFSMAHELGHHILHVLRYPVFRDVKLGSVDDWAAFHSKLSTSDHFKLEWHANQFAGRFLVPLDDLVSEFEHAKKRFRSTSSGFLSDSNVVEICPLIARKFNVSAECIRIRIAMEELNG